MAFEAVQNLAVQQAAEDERRRRQELAQLADQAAEQKLDAADSPAATYAKAQKQGRTSISGPLAADASDYQQLETNERTRLERRAAPLQVPGPSAPERMQQMLGEVQQLGEPMPGEERSTRLSRLEAARERTLGDITDQHVPRETSPIFYGGGHPAGGGDDTGSLTYGGALAGLQGAEVPRAGIRPEFGGTAKDELLSFTNYDPKPGMKRYNAPSGETKDLGAPVGSLGSISGGGGQGGKAGDALRSDLDRLIAETKAAPLNPREEAGALVAAEPTWDATAADLGDPAAIGQQINQAVADGTLDPKVGAHLQTKYARLAHAATDDDGFLDSRVFQQLLGAKRPPAPGEAEHQAATGGKVIPEAEAEKVAMLHSVQEGVLDAPGTTLPPEASPESSPVPTVQPTPAQAPQMTATRRPAMATGTDEELQAFIDGIAPRRGMAPDAAAKARERDALLSSLRR